MSQDPWGRPARETFAHHCATCEGASTLEVIERWQMIPEGDDDWEPFEWTAARCTTCRHPYVFTAEPIWGGVGYGVRVQEYPTSERALPHSVPPDVRDAFQEAQKCIRAHAYVATALMARRVVESIRKGHGYTSQRDLLSALKAMRDDGLLDPRLYEWADAVREVGNEGAHDTDKRVSREDATEALFFAEALIDYLYVFRDRHEAFKRRREAFKEGRDPLALEPLDLQRLTGAAEIPPSADSTRL